MSAVVSDWASKVRAGDVRAISRAITAIENHSAEAEELLRELFPHTGKAYLTGVTGAPGTGKSRLGRRLGAALEAQVVESDRVRKQLFAEPRYTGGEHAAVYGWCHNLLRSALQVGRPVIFDATNLEERVRRKVYDIAEQCDARLLIVWATCSPARTTAPR